MKEVSVGYNNSSQPSYTWKHTLLIIFYLFSAGCVHFDSSLYMMELVSRNEQKVTVIDSTRFLRIIKLLNKVFFVKTLTQLVHVWSTALKSPLLFLFLNLWKYVNWNPCSPHWSLKKDSIEKQILLRNHSTTVCGQILDFIYQIPTCSDLHVLLSRRFGKLPFERYSFCLIFVSKTCFS